MGPAGRREGGMGQLEGGKVVWGQLEGGKVVWAS